MRSLLGASALADSPRCTLKVLHGVRCVGLCGVRPLDLDSQGLCIGHAPNRLGERLRELAFRI